MQEHETPCKYDPKTNSVTHLQAEKPNLLRTIRRAERLADIDAILADCRGRRVLAIRAAQGVGK